MTFNKTRTERGFQVLRFEDCNKQQCSIQVESNVKKQIMLGADNISLDEDSEPYNSRALLGRKESFKVALKLLLFSITGRLFINKKK